MKLLQTSTSLITIKIMIMLNLLLSGAENICAGDIIRTFEATTPQSIEADNIDLPVGTDESSNNAGVEYNNVRQPQETQSSDNDVQVIGDNNNDVEKDETQCSGQKRPGSENICPVPYKLTKWYVV
jgi:hypothetical protein